MKKRRASGHSADVPPRAVDDEADTETFEREMADVVPLRPDPRGRIRASPAIAAPRQTMPPVEHAEDSLEDFAAPGVDRREIRRLKRGAYDAEDRTDLHGDTAAESCASVRRFLENSRHRRYRCVCIVHGRGLHSTGGAAVVKARVRDLLRTHPSVLAFADAPRSDGGAGAVYVLLRS
jgi:DNA-nicking Smr family endonuclease